MTNQYTNQDILDLGTGFKVDGFDQLWRAIGRLPFLSEDGPYAWRGVPDSIFETRSSLYRRLARQGDVTEELMRDQELSILSEARRWGLGRTGSGEMSDLQLLALMQHHGSPTRLLDVTSNPLTALWFACGDKLDKDGLLLAFNLDQYEMLQAENNRMTYGSMSDPLGWHLKNALDKSASNRLPSVLSPIAADQRMIAQEGFFLLSACPEPSPMEYREVPRPSVDGIYLRESALIPFGIAHSMLFDDSPIIPNFPQAMWSFKIPANLKLQVLRALDVNFNKSARTLFPDPAGFATHSLAALRATE